MKKDMPKSPIILLDTNIWLDYFFDRRNTARDIARLFSMSKDSLVTLVYAPTIIKDVFYFVQRDLKADFRKAKTEISQETFRACQEGAWSCIDFMTEVAVSLSQGEFQVQIARNLKNVHFDFEDDLILALLQTDSVDYFITEDVKLREKSPKGAFSPADMVAYLEAI